MTNKIKDAIYTKRYVYNLHFHLIWCTKYRNKTFTNEKLSNEMKDILQRVADDNEIVIEKMEVMPDHVHMLISFPPRKSAIDVIKALKGRSAFLFLQTHPEIRQKQYWGGHLWSSSYYLGSLGSMSKDVVENILTTKNIMHIKNRTLRVLGLGYPSPH